MNNSHAEGIATDFSSRERQRTYEFSRVWKNKLDAVFKDVAPYYDFASNCASLGLCIRWRRKFISFIDVKSGEKVLDICAGTNGVGISLLQKQPDLEVFALDRSEAMQKVGKANAEALGFHIESFIDDVHKLPFPDNSFDAVTLQWATRHLRVVDVFSEVMRVLKPGGRFYHCDMLRPQNKVIEFLYSLYLKTCVSTTALVFRSGSEARSCCNYFVRAIQMFYSSAELAELMTDLGFTQVSYKNAIGGIVACHKAVKV